LSDFLAAVCTDAVFPGLDPRQSGIDVVELTFDRVDQAENLGSFSGYRPGISEAVPEVEVGSEVA
jgi:hypothetical protein